MLTDDEKNIVESDIVDYLDQLAGVSPDPAPSMEKEAETRGFPIVGPQVGRLLSLISGMIRPGRIVELGSGFGYSALWFGLGAPRAEIHLTEFDPDNLESARNYLAKTNHPERYVYHEGDALETVQDIRGPVECIFLDLEKEDYPTALDWARERLAPGGTLIADNVLWQGKVAESNPEDSATRAVQEFNERLYEDPWSSSILPIRDGVAIARKKGPIP